MVLPRIFNSPWFILIIVLLVSMAAPLNQFKVPPVLPLLIEAFSLPPARAGLLMSIFAITGLILAFPGGFIYQKIGPRLTGFIALLTLIGGTALGLLSSHLTEMLIGRFIEGAGMSLMSILAPALIALWFDEGRRGRAMGIWAIWVPLGSTIMFLIAPFLAAYGGWQGVWLFAGFYTLLITFLYFLLLKPSPTNLSAKKEISFTGESTPLKLSRVFLNRDLWLISLLFCCFNFVFIAFVTWVPTFLNQEQNISLTHAALTVSLVNLLSIVACPTSGWISDKLGSRKIFCLLPMLLMAFLFPLAFYLKGNNFFLLCATLGFVGGFIPPGVFAAAAELVQDRRLHGLVMAVVQIGQNAGMLFGPLVFGLVVEYGGGWEGAFWFLIPVSISGALAAWATKIK